MIDKKKPCQKQGLAMRLYQARNLLILSLICHGRLNHRF